MRSGHLLTSHELIVNSSCSTKKAAGGPISIIFTPSGLSSLDQSVSHRRHQNHNLCLSGKTPHLRYHGTLSLVSLRMMDYLTESQLAVEEEHWCWLHAGESHSENNCLREGERGV